MSSAGKDKILNELLKEIPNLHNCVSHTTRPMRENEGNHREYHFITYTEFEDMASCGDFLEVRNYKTVNGYWYYGLAKNELVEGNNIVIVDLDGLKEIIHKLGKENVVSFYIKANHKVRLLRSISREPNIQNKGVEEVCRRLLDDSIKFKQAENICDYILENEKKEDLSQCIASIKEIIERN